MKDYEPEEFAAGETVEWRKSLTDYGPADGWVLTYYFRGPEDAFDATATADGNSWKVTLAVPADVRAGRIDWQAWVSKGDEERLVGKGVATVGVSFKANAPVDNRSQAEKDLDAVRAALVPATSAGVQEYEIGGVGSSRRLRNYNREDLLRLEESLAQRVNAEKLREARANGAPYFKTIYPR